MSRIGRPRRIKRVTPSQVPDRPPAPRPEPVPASPGREDEEPAER